MIKDNCSICGDTDAILIPKAGSGTNVSLICPKCIRNHRLEILDEYKEKIDDYFTNIDKTDKQKELKREQFWEGIHG